MKTKSIWGNPPKRLYKLLNILKSENRENVEICIVGCSDGKFLMPFARAGIKVTGYDIDEIALYGGEKLFPIKEVNIKYEFNTKFKSKDFPLEKRRVYGVCERLHLENLESFANVKLLDFYKNTPSDSFDLVFTSCSLHYSKNAEYSLQDKVQKLGSIVKKGGYLYLDYMMAIVEDDYENFPESKFFRKGQIKNMLSDCFEIIYNKENFNPSFEGAHVDCVKDHFHRFGYIFARRIK